MCKGMPLPDQGTRTLSSVQFWFKELATSGAVGKVFGRMLQRVGHSGPCTCMDHLHLIKPTSEGRTEQRERSPLPRIRIPEETISPRRVQLLDKTPPEKDPEPILKLRSRESMGRSFSLASVRKIRERMKESKKEAKKKIIPVSLSEDPDTDQEKKEPPKKVPKKKKEKKGPKRYRFKPHDPSKCKNRKRECGLRTKHASRVV